MAQLANVLRSATDTLEQTFGEEAARVLEDAVAEHEGVMLEHFNFREAGREAEGSSHPSPSLT